MMRTLAKRLGEESDRFSRKRNKYGLLGISWKVELWSEDTVSLPISGQRDLSNVFSDC